MSPLHIITRCDRRAESYRAPDNNERRAAWAAKYFGNGHHNRQQKPRIRVTVPQAKAEN
jgi:hypothetical protein